MIAAWRALFIAMVSSSISFEALSVALRHRDELRGEECRVGLEHRRVDRELEILRQQAREHELGRGRELDRAARLRRRSFVPSCAPLGALEGRSCKIGTSLRVCGRLRHHRDRASARRARSREISPPVEIVGRRRGDFARRLELRRRSKRPRRVIGHAQAPHGVARFDADRVVLHRALRSRAKASAAAITLELNAPASPLSAVIRMMPARRALLPGFMNG